MWHSKVPAPRANFGSCDWISLILGLLKSHEWDEFNHPKTACVRCFLPKLGSFRCCESSEIFNFLFQESFTTNSTLLPKWSWNQPILTVINLIILPWILQVQCTEIHLWVISWDFFDKIHYVVMLSYCIISIWLELLILQIDLVCHIRLGISFLKVFVGVFHWLTLPFYAVLGEYLIIQTSQQCY